MESAHEKQSTLIAGLDDTPRILVVDDDSSTRVLLRAALELDGYIVDEAPDGAAALAVFERSRPDVVLLDAVMPHMDGFSVCLRMRSTPAAAKASIMMVTSLESAGDIARAFDAGANDYVTKPINHALLRHRLRRTS